jgi:hypothetical protein
LLLVGVAIAKPTRGKFKAGITLAVEQDKGGWQVKDVSMGAGSERE